MKTLKSFVLFIAIALTVGFFATTLVQSYADQIKIAEYKAAVVAAPDQAVLACPFTAGSWNAYQATCPGVYPKIYGGQFTVVIADNHKIAAMFAPK